MDNVNNNANLIWNIADHLRGVVRATDYGKVVIPFTILRRMDCTLEGTKEKVLSEYRRRKDMVTDVDPFLRVASGLSFYNTSKFTLTTLLDDPANIESNLLEYISGFSESVSDIFSRFKLAEEISTLAENDLLYLTVQKFAGVDFHPDTVSNHEMGLLFEELIRKFAEDSAADNGEFFTPRDAINLAVRILFAADEDYLNGEKAPMRDIYDPTAGTGGMLSVASEWLSQINPDAELNLFGQELNPHSYAICKSDMIAKGQNISNIKLGNTLTQDALAGHNFDYVIANPPYGAKWEKEKTAVEKEHKDLGFEGRFGAGLPASSDGQLLFLLHAIDKLRKVKPDGSGGGRAGVILNGSSLFSGDAGSGASNIRKWVFENDLVDTIVALPTNMFYSTGIATYIWLIDNNKPEERRGKVQLIDASNIFSKMRKSLGGKTRLFTEENIEEIVNLYKNDFGTDSDTSKTFRSEEFGFRVVTVEQPLKKKYLWNEEASKNLADSVGFQRLDSKRQADLIRMAERSLSEVVFSSYNSVDKEISSVAKNAGLKITATDKKILIDSMSTDALGEGNISFDSKGNIVADPSRRDTETVPLLEELDEYINREVKPFASDAWVDEAKTKIGYEVPFNRHFYKAEILRPLPEIQSELKAKIVLITSLLGV